MRWVLEPAPEPTSEYLRLAAEYDRCAEQRDAEIQACPGHQWLMEFEYPDEEYGGCVALRCTRCPAELGDMYPDGHDMLYLHVNGEAIVEEGEHKLPYAATVPVTFEIVTHHSSTPNGEEWDVELNVTALGEILPHEEDA